MAVGIPPHSSVDVDVLHKQRHQQVEEEQELKQQAAVQRQVGDTGVTHWLWGDEGGQWRRWQPNRVTASKRLQESHCYEFKNSQEQLFAKKKSPKNETEN